jgi:membrane protein implicated in regulation of membrane protease activity
MDLLFDYLLNNHDKLLYGIASISLLVELTVIGLSGPLLFFAIACFLTGLLVSFNLISSWELEILLVGIFTLMSAVILWKPLKQFQGTTKVVDNSSDMIGQVVRVSETVTVNDGSIRYSGINWNARLASDSEVDSIESNIFVTITAMDGNVAIVDQKQQ